MLSKNDIEALTARGHDSLFAIQQIKDALKVTSFTLYEGDSQKGKRVSARTARKILGTETFLSGISRSAFHFKALRESGDGEKTVLFDSSRFFDVANLA